jgi:hypothetical protein
MGLYRTISNEIKAVLLATDVFADIRDYPTNVFTGFPAAAFYPSSTPSDYATQKQNRRDYVFTLQIFALLKDPDRKIDVVLPALQDLVDTVMDALDSTEDLNGVVNFLRPVPNMWSMATMTKGQALMATLTLHCEKDIQYAIG